MPETKHCQSCDAELPAGDSGSVCAACMLAKGFDDDSRIETIEITTGRTFSGYEIIRKLGTGGMGVVYEALQISLRRPVALKMIRTPSAASPKDMARFRQEAEAAARLDHPNIVEVYEIGELEGCPYFTMKYVEGAQSLHSELTKGPFDPRRAAELVCTVARAVAYAHQRGIIHRDLKPANILLDRDGRPCLVDFGLAKLFGMTSSLAEAAANLSDDGKLMGTPHYMSPEQISGDDLTTATDVYSLGVVLYELLSGSPPFQSKALHEMLDDISHTPPKTLAMKGKKLERDLEVICFKCLRKQPKNRYATADALADDLERWMNRRPIHARPSSKRDRISKWARRHPGVAVLSPVVTVLAIVAMAALFGLWRNSVKDLEDSVLKPLAEAKAQRADKVAGRRWIAIDSLKLATSNLRVLPGKLAREYRKQLQNEALACLSLIDLRPSDEHADKWQGDPEQCGLVRLSPDFSIYAHAMKDGSVVVRDRRSNNVQISLPSPGPKRCVKLRFDGDGRRLAAVYENDDGSYQFIVWDFASEKSIRSGSLSSADAIDFSADGSLLVVARGDAIVIESLTGDGKSREFKTTFSAGSLSLDRDTNLLAASPVTEPGVALFDFASGELLSSFAGPRVLDLDWNPRGRWLAMACDDGRAIVWDTEADDGSEDRELPLWAEGQSAIEHIAWHPRGVLICGTSSAGKVHLWHVARGELEVSWSGSGYLDDPQFSQGATGGSRLGPVIDGANVSLLEVAEGRIVSHARGHPGKIYGSWWRDSGRIFTTAGNDGVRIWNRRGFEKAFIPEADARAAIFTGEGLLITGRNGISLRSVKAVGVISVSATIRIGPPQRFDETIRCYDADYDPVNRRLAVATGDHVRIYAMQPMSESPALTLVEELAAPEHTAFVDFSADGNWLAAGTNGGNSVRVWKTGGEWDTVEADFPVQGSANVVFYHDPTPLFAHCFVTVGTSEYRFYDTGTWKHRKSIQADLGKELGAISFSPRTAVFGVSQGGWIRIYALHTFEQLISPEFGFHEPVAFSPGGGIIMTADRAERNTHLHLWDLRLLRKELDKLNLDLELKDFDEDPAPVLIETVILDK